VPCSLRLAEEQELTFLLSHRLFKSPLTTPDIKACVEDLKVLGKKDFKNLLKYRLAVREDVRYPIFILLALVSDLYVTYSSDWTSRLTRPRSTPRRLRSSLLMRRSKSPRRCVARYLLPLVRSVAHLFASPTARPPLQGGCPSPSPRSP